MDTETLLTIPERTAFTEAMQRNYGQCQCQSVQPTNRGPVKIDTCAGHLFLQEQDHHVSRIQRLLFVRRTLDQWYREEQTGICKECGEHKYHLPGAVLCEDCSVTAYVDRSLLNLPW